MMRKEQQGLEVWGLLLRKIGGLAKLGIFDHNNTQDRIYTLPDNSGSVLLDTTLDSTLGYHPASWSRLPLNDANLNLSTTQNTIIGISAITLTRTLKLPSATTSGQLIWVIDETGNCNSSINLNIIPNGTDTISANSVINSAFGMCRLISNGSGKWTVDIAAGGSSTINTYSMISGWTKYTPSTVGITIGNGVLAGLWRREGDSMRIRIELVIGSTTSFTANNVNLAFSLPSGYTPNFAVGGDAFNGIEYSCGTWHYFTNSPSYVGWSGSVTLAPSYGYLLLNAPSGQNRISGGNNPINLSYNSSGNWITMDALIPVNEFTANVNLVTDFQEFLSCNGTGTNEGVAANTTYTSSSPVRSSSGSLIPNVTISGTTATTVTTYNLTPLTPLKPTDLLILEVNNGTGWVQVGQLPQNAIGSGYSGSIPIGAMLSISNGLISVSFSNAGRTQGSSFGSALLDWATINTLGWKWRVRKITNGNFADNQPWSRIPVADTNYSLSSFLHSIISYTSLTVSRVVTLPSASTSGQLIWVVDESGNCSPTSTITVNANGTDTIEGLSSYLLSSQNAAVCFLANGNNKWTVLTYEEVPITISDSNYTISLREDVIIFMNSITTSRNITLPPATTSGQRIQLIDSSGACSSTVTINAIPNGTDTVNVTASVNSAYGSIKLISNGKGKWVIDSSFQNSLNSGNFSLLGNWASYTPVLTNVNLGTGGGAYLFWRREGDSMRIQGLIHLGKGGSLTGIMQFTLPSGYTWDVSKLGNGYPRCGIANIYNPSTNYDTSIYDITGLNDGKSFCFQGQNQAGTYSQFSSTFPVTFGANYDIQIIEFLIPISQWSSNINLATDYHEYLSCDGSAGVAANTTYVAATYKGSDGSLIPSVTISSTTATTNTTYTLTVQNPIKATDLFILELNNGTGWFPMNHQNVWINNTVQGGTYIGIQITPVSSTQVNVMFSNAGRTTSGVYGTAANTWAAINTWKWRLRKISNGNFAQQLPYDYLSPLSNSEISITGATTLNSGRMHVCSGTVNYAVTLPLASTCLGQFIGVRMSSSLTSLITITASGTDKIDGLSTRVMWSGESAILYSDGTNWTKISGKTIPLRACLQKSTQQAIANNTETVIQFNQILYQSISGIADTTNFRMNVLRNNAYKVCGTMYFDPNAATMANVQTATRVYVSGGQSLDQIFVFLMAQ